MIELLIANREEYEVNTHCCQEWFVIDSAKQEDISLFQQDVEEYINNTFENNGHYIIKYNVLMNDEKLNIYIPDNASIYKLEEIQAGIERWENNIDLFKNIINSGEDVEEILLETIPEDYL